MATNMTGVPPIAYNQIKNIHKLINYNLGWYTPHLKELKLMFRARLFCQNCKHCDDSSRISRNFCKFCAKELVYYRGPIYGRLLVEQETFVKEEVINQNVVFITEESSNQGNVFSRNTMTVQMSTSWPALTRSFRDGVYSGFYIQRPRYLINGEKSGYVGNLLTPFQAAIYERFSVALKSYEQKVINTKKNNFYVLPMSFVDVVDSVEMPIVDRELFLKVLTKPPEQVRKNLDDILHSDVFGT